MEKVNMMKRVKLLASLAVFAAATLGPDAQAQVRISNNDSPLFVAAHQRSSSVKSKADRLRGVPEIFAAQQNYPNPFNSTTTIEYSLPQEAGVYVSIYNIFGHRVRTLVNETGNAGHHVVSWDGRNNAGEPVASGVYFYRLVADDYFAVRKMLLLK
jgi:flagellar hook assembly protein FlgD